MAMSKAVQQETYGLDLIWKSRVLHAEILLCFRECHDVCIQSKLFTNDIILQIDQCAVDFRQLSFDTVTIAKRVSNQWLDGAITFFENIDDVDDPKEMLQLLGSQARGNECFKLIAAWAKNLALRFHEAQGGTIKEVEEFRMQFEAAVQRAESVRKQAEEKLSKARQAAQDSEDSWKTASVALSWMPVSFLVTGPGMAIAEKKTAEATQLANEELRKSEHEFGKRKSQNEKAKVLIILHL